MILRRSDCPFSSVGTLVVRRDKVQREVTRSSHLLENVAALVVHADRVNGNTLAPPKKNGLFESGCRRFISEVRQWLDMNISAPT
jgi:hypothetical protein